MALGATVGPEEVGLVVVGAALGDYVCPSMVGVRVDGTPVGAALGIDVGLALVGTAVVGPTVGDQVSPGNVGSRVVGI
jgi:hypothetical protein